VIKEMTKPDRLIAIGDIHGELDQLNRLLNTVAPTSNDRLVFLGDYIDRGKNSKGVIDRLIRFREEFPDTVFIRGNHDQMLLDTLIEAGATSGHRLRDQSSAYRAGASESDIAIFMFNGGNQTLRSYRINHLSDFPKEHIAFLQSTRLWWRYEHFVFVHAGIGQGIPLEKQDPFVLMWERLSPPGQEGEIHVVGHHPTTDGEPCFEPGRYQLDTGAVYGRTLTACDVLTREVWQVR
jgi:serine/threonine protein phosphatase 1